MFKKYLKLRINHSFENYDNLFYKDQLKHYSFQKETKSTISNFKDKI